MFGQGEYLLISIYHDIGRLVESRRYRCPDGSDAEDAGDEANLGHGARSPVSMKSIQFLLISIEEVRKYIEENQVASELDLRRPHYAACRANPAMYCCAT